jgi:hypothetical protein
MCLKRIGSLLISSLLLIGISFGQSDSKNRNGLRILSEKNKIEIEGNNSYSLQIRISKRCIYKIVDEEGLNRISKRSLPETFDSSYIRHFPKARNYMDLFSGMDVNYYKAEVLLPNGERSLKNIRENTEEVKMVGKEDRYGLFNKVNYTIEDLKVGDNVEIFYGYSIPFSENYLDFLSFRIFFNGALYKEKYELEISFPTKHNVTCFGRNNGEADTTYSEDNRSILKWKKEQLEGNILEVGSRPYLTLPYIILSVKPISFSYRIQNTNTDAFLPTYSLFSSVREYRHLDLVKSMDQGLRFKQYNLMNKFFDENTAAINNDSTGYFRLKKIKNLIADEHSFLDDEDFFENYDVKLRNIGSHISRNELRDISRQEIYIALIRYLKLEYYTTYISDVRCGEVDNEFLKPMDEDDYFLTPVTKDSRLQFIYPKKDDFGYYLNEFPFYFEGAKARVVHLSDYKRYKEMISDKLKQTLIPSSGVNNNTRTTYILGNVSADTISFKAKVNLSGQFSTMTRGLYKNGYIDNTINPNYNKKIWEMNKKVSVTDSNLIVNSKQFPFNATVTGKYQVVGLLEKINDTININLNYLIRHIVENIDSNKRSLDYYSDFLGSDSYVYYIKFDKEIDIINSDNSFNVKNDFGTYSFEITKTNSKSIKISSFLLIKDKLVEVDSISEVVELYSNVKKCLGKNVKLLLNE